VVALVQEEAGRFWQDYTGTEHLLLDLLCEEESGAAQALRAFGAALDELCGQVEGIAARVLSNLDVDPDAVRREVVRGLSEAGREADFRTESIPCWGKRGWPIPVPGHVAGIRMKLDLSRPLGVSVDAAHSYRASARFPAGSPIVELVDVADLVRAPGSWRQMPQTWKSS